MNNITDHLEHMELNQILTGLPAYIPKHDSNPEPFLWQLKNNLQIVNFHPSMWNMAFVKYSQGSKTASHWLQNNIVILHLSWHEARDVYTTHLSSIELQIYLHNEFFKLNYQPKEPVRKVIKRIDNVLQLMMEQLLASPENSHTELLPQPLPSGISKKCVTLTELAPPPSGTNQPFIDALGATSLGHANPSFSHNAHKGEIRLGWFLRFH
ncbi:hypothetical protein QOT17_018787 [Balamuthia mandrillaris]